MSMADFCRSHPRPPRVGTNRPSRRMFLKRNVAIPVLFALMTLAFCGMAVEGFFIYQLYQTQDLVSSTACLMPLILLTDFSRLPLQCLTKFCYTSVSHLSMCGSLQALLYCVVLNCLVYVSYECVICTFLSMLLCLWALKEFLQV